ESNPSNLDICHDLITFTSPIPAKTILLKEKEENEFPDSKPIRKRKQIKLQQKLSNTFLEPSSQDHSISKNIKPGHIMEYMGLMLCDTTIDAEDRAFKANQEEIMCWSLYAGVLNFKLIR
ncbi:4900_t:CDS:2, partial [Acaulospora morrowiae]